MELQSDQLRALVAVIDHATFEAAAGVLGVTPSAVSQRIKALEIASGRVLLERSKPVRTTASGAVVLRLARQFALLEQDALAALHERPSHPAALVRIPIAVNADSLATWVLPALASIAEHHGVVFAIHSEDEGHSAQLLRDGTVMAAITSDSRLVQGCALRKLGRMRYRARANPAFAARWFATGAGAKEFATAPLIVFSDKDDLQDRYLRRLSRKTLDPPRHQIPASAEFLSAIRLGLGWGMVPDLQADHDDPDGGLVDLNPGRVVDVPLYWQQWKLQSTLLNTITDAISTAAAAALR